MDPVRPVGLQSPPPRALAAAKDHPRRPGGLSEGALLVLLGDPAKGLPAGLAGVLPVARGGELPGAFFGASEVDQNFHHGLALGACGGGRAPLPPAVEYPLPPYPPPP